MEKQLEGLRVRLGRTKIVAVVAVVAAVVLAVVLAFTLFRPRSRLVLERGTRRVELSPDGLDLRDGKRTLAHLGLAGARPGQSDTAELTLSDERGVARIRLGYTEPKRTPSLDLNGTDDTLSSVSPEAVTVGVGEKMTIVGADGLVAQYGKQRVAVGVQTGEPSVRLFATQTTAPAVRLGTGGLLVVGYRHRLLLDVGDDGAALVVEDRQHDQRRRFGLPAESGH